MADHFQPSEVPSWNPEAQPENSYGEELPDPGVIENFESQQAYEPPQMEQAEPSPLSETHDSVYETYEAQQETTEAAPYDFSQTLDAATEPVDNSNLSEIADFANGEAAIGGMSYELLISGLDSVALIREFKEIISDARFAWNEEEILSQIKRGELVIKDLPPIKAAILVNRLKYLELKISWRQSVYT